MAKNIPLKDSVVVDDTDLSEFCNAWQPQSEFSLQDVSGFNATGSDENLVGTRASSVTANFFPCEDVKDVLWPAHFNRDIISFVARRDMTAPVSSSNPEFRGHVYVQNYNEDRTRGSNNTFPVTFIAADSDGLQWYDAIS